MSGDARSKILDVERALEARREEASERRDERGEDGHDDAMQLEGIPRDRGDGVVRLWDVRSVPFVRGEVCKKGMQREEGRTRE